MSTSLPQNSLRVRVQQGLLSLASKPTGSGGYTSDLTIDEELCLHAIGWEPVELVSGVSYVSIPFGMWNWGQGEITGAGAAHQRAFTNAINQLREAAKHVGGHGVVGVHVERRVNHTHVEISLLGTAVRPEGQALARGAEVFVSDLSARDFTLLHRAGWDPVGLTAGASFVYAPRRSVSATLQQQSQNVELANYTQAITSARETAMERMQQMAVNLKGAGVVAVQIVEGPMSFASHAVQFAAWGTVVRERTTTHDTLAPRTVVALDDVVNSFEAATLA